MWFSKSNFKPEGKTALIVGASQGIGANLALKLFKRNCSVILAARTKSKLISQIEKIEKEVGKSESASLSYISCDVSNYEESVKMWEEIVVNRKQDPEFIFCCAGSSIPKLFNDLSGQELASGVSINYSTAVNTVHAGFKQIISANPITRHDQFKHRHIILFSSVVSFFPFIGYSQYAPMKAAIQSLSIVLRQELGPYNYRISCVFPGNFQSEGFEEEQKTKPEITKSIEGPSHPIPGEECADLIIDKLSKGYDTITTDLIGWVLGCSALGVLPREWSLFQIIVSFIFSIVSPLGSWIINRDILKFFGNKKYDTEEFEIVEHDKKSE